MRWGRWGREDRVSIRALAALCAGGVLFATGAGAETYRIVEGRLDDAGTGASEVLEGVLEISVREGFPPPFAQSECPTIPPSPEPPHLSVDDFELHAGARSFGRQEPAVFEGRALLSLPDLIHFDGDTVESARLRSGGELVSVDARGATFRYLDFRSQAPDAGRLVGHLGNTLLPRRISLVGTLYEVDRILPRAPTSGGGVGGGGGGVIVIGGGGGALEVTQVGSLFHRFESFDLQVESAVGFEAPALRRAALARVTGREVVTLEGRLVSGGSLELVSPSRLVFSETNAAAVTTSQGLRVAGLASTPAAPPTLAELGITAPSGAEVTFDDAGALTVHSEGDLLVAGGLIDVPGLTSLTLVTAGSITVRGTLELPPGVSLRLNAGSSVVIDGDLPLPGGVVTAPEAPILCASIGPRLALQGARPASAPGPADGRVVGSFSLVASAAEQVEVEFEPRHRPGGKPPGRHGSVSVALLGSADLDIRDVDERSLRLGPGEAEPADHRGRHRTHRADVNRDGEVDLVVRFDAREAGIAADATEVCLFGETTGGAAIEGCDAIERKAERERRAQRRDDHDRRGRGR
jgi:filamentous hemagglutinin family protein